LKNFDEQTAKDLEFDAIRQMLANACVGPTARTRMEGLRPLASIKVAERELRRAQELLMVKEEQEGFPRLEFEELAHEIKRMGIRNAILRDESFVRLLIASNLINDVLLYFKGRGDEFPTLVELLSRTAHSNSIIRPIEKVFDKRMKVKDDASQELAKIRQAISSKRRQIAGNFNKVLKRLQGKGYLGDSNETVLNDRRVLSVLSTHKRSVGGRTLGGSKSGHLTSRCLYAWHL